ncbi:hypothetical protein E3Q22_00497 [Wallemia mellicola]|uniref:Mini-chromosome maintenance complex-binding protein n=2 Tax=Wallemia mellicola TaxID=1708541 RepID=A0A4T0P345_9BASI|nr:hypothetical protein E3Q23_04127 [Wallemia mellicola]TIB82144.1 hypothetical protein E3Q22_00497 [Wallemia mellicola]TIB95826.1 hypothetical protein E3Q18_03488 [Wallemia mellicola]TIC04506.1 hypothetical protein E3Q17_00486 [Wallemia mellicola]TIC09309.1 hypothetical protein E3Q14_03451 [Wallemia mellicola]
MVNSHRDAFFKNPSEVIQQLYEKHGLDSIEDKLIDEFNNLVNLPTDIDSIPELESADFGTLVRWTAMVQDTGYGTEMYISTSSNDKCLVYGANQNEDVQFDNDQDDFSRIRERTNIYAVEIPGNNNESKPIKEDLLGGPSHKFPLQDRNNKLGVLLKLYDNDSGGSLRPATVYEFVGILGKSALPRTLDSIEEDNVQETIVPSLHVLYSQQVDNKPSSVVVEKDVGEHIITWLADEVLGGDKLAAHYLLLSLVSKTQSRKAGSPIGTLPITLSLPENENTSELKIVKAIEALTNLSVYLALSIDKLNERRLYPHSNGDDLNSGSLQVSPSTCLIFDERHLGQGTLKDTGVRNVHSIQNVIQSQKLEYNFPFSAFPFETDLITVILTDHSKSIIPGTIHINVKPTSDNYYGELSIPKHIKLWKEFILQSRQKQVTIPDEVSSIIQQSFVDERQAHKQNGGTGEGTSSDDLGRRITMARLLTSLDDGESNTMNNDHWNLITKLEKEREERC